MQLSIIVPIKNGEKYLEECLDSICRQTFRDFELILINDASTDNTQKILENYSKKDERIVLLYADNLKVNAVRKKGLDIARGKYVGFVDCDDWIEEEMFESLIEECERWNLDMISSSMIREFQEEGYSDNLYDAVEEGIYDKKRLEKELYPYMLYKDPFYTHGIQPNMWNKVFKKELLCRAFEDMDMDIVYGEDGAVVYAALLMSERVEVLKKVFYHYRIHGKSATHTASEELLGSALKLHNQLKKTFEKSTQSKGLLRQLDYFTVATDFFNLKRCYGIDIYQMMEWYMPFASVIEGKKVALYGAGKIGKSFYKQINERTGAEIIVWVDKRYESIEQKEDVIINSPSFLDNSNVDYVIIAVRNAQDADNIRKEIRDRGYDSNRILWQIYHRQLFP